MSTLSVNNVQDLGADAVVTNGVVNASALPAGSILQVVSTTKTDTYTMSSTTFTKPTNFDVSITPSSTASKVLITGTLNLRSTEGTNNAYARLMRDSTPIFLGDADGSRVQGFVVESGGAGNNSPNHSFVFLDSPNTTSAISYSVEVRANNANPIFVNRSQADSNDASGMRTASTITVMEVAG